VDLSRADFEQHGGEGDIDNPFVPDLIRVRAGTGAFGRGYPFAFGLAYVLALPSAVRQLEPRTLAILDGGELTVYRIARDQVLDVAGIMGTVASLVATGYYRGGGRDCRSPFMSPVFERDPSQIAEYTIPKASPASCSGVLCLVSNCCNVRVRVRAILSTPSRCVAHCRSRNRAAAVPLPKTRNQAARTA